MPRWVEWRNRAVEASDNAPTATLMFLQRTLAWIWQVARPERFERPTLRFVV